MYILLVILLALHCMDHKSIATRCSATNSSAIIYYSIAANATGIAKFEKLYRVLCVYNPTVYGIRLLKIISKIFS